MEEQKKRKKTIVIVIGLVFLLGASILGIKYWLSEEKMAFVAEQVELGQRYLIEMNYEEAIVAFTKAIEAEPKSVESYLGLSAAYEGQGNYEEAMAILEEGFRITEDIRLSERLEYLRVLFVYVEFPNNQGYADFLPEQSAIVTDPGTEWLNATGLMSATILDFDSDGSDELLVCIAEECGHDNSGDSHIMMYLYEIKDGEVMLADSLPMGAYDGTEQTELLLRQDHHAGEFVAVNAVKIDGKHYIVCEHYRNARVFAMGSSQDYWVLEYENGELRYAGSAIVPAASSEKVLTGYIFSEGALTTSDLLYHHNGYSEYYDEWDVEFYGGYPLYSDFGQALTAFFDNWNISLRPEMMDGGFPYYSGSKLSSENDSAPIFEFTIEDTKILNINTDARYWTYEFSAILRNGDTTDTTDTEEYESDVYMEFLNTKGYEKYLSQTPSWYELIDINQDGVAELVFVTLVYYLGLGHSYRYDFFYYDSDNGQICYTNESHYGDGLYQSAQYAATVIWYEGDYCYYYGNSEGELIDMFRVTYLENVGTYLDGEKLPEGAYDVYRDELTEV